MEETVQSHNTQHTHGTHHEHHHHHHHEDAQHHSKRAGQNRKTKTQIRRKVLGNLLFTILSILAILILLVIAYDHWIGLF